MPAGRQCTRDSGVTSGCLAFPCLLLQLSALLLLATAAAAADSTTKEAPQQHVSSAAVSSSSSSSSGLMLPPRAAAAAAAVATGTATQHQQASASAGPAGTAAGKPTPAAPAAEPAGPGGRRQQQQALLQNQQQQQDQQQQARHLQQQQQQVQQQQQTPAQRAAARWYERQRQQRAGIAVSPKEDLGFVIPVPPPGAPNPHEVQVPLYSPDQLRIRHKLIPGVPLQSQIISLQEQLQQAEALGTALTPAQLEGANPLLGPKGPVQVPEKTQPSEFPDGYVAICAIVKDQGRDVREWLEYHRWLGVGKVYVYDNNSTVPLSSTLTDLMHAGFVEYAFFTGQPRYRDLFRTSSQWWAYNDCVHRFRHRHRWLAFIDADEFIVLRDPRFNPPSWEQQQQQQQTQSHGAGGSASSAAGAAAAAANSGGSSGSSSSGGSSGSSGSSSGIDAFLQQYDGYGGLALNWVIFGSSGHAMRPRGGVLVNYHACLPDQHEQNTHVKVIANTKYLLTVGDDPHRVYYSSTQHWTVNELGEKVTQARTAAPSHTKAALYHYLTKSEQEYMQKMRRGSAAGNYKSPEFFQTINQYATDTCTAALPLGLACCPSVHAELGPQGVQQVRERMAGLQQRQAQDTAGAGAAAAGAA